MSIEILSIGNELLSGHTVNTNASVISQKLLRHGFAVDRVTYLPDEPTLLKEGIEEAMKSRWRTGVPPALISPKTVHSIG